MAKIDLNPPLLGTLKYEQNGKRIVAYCTYRRDNKIFNVSYYSDEYDKKCNSKFHCCQSPTFARTWAGALRKINKFFNE